MYDKIVLIIGRVKLKKKLTFDKFSMKVFHNELGHCVGSYFDRIVSNKILIVGIYKEKQLKYTIEINSSGTIIQNKAKYNKYMCENVEDYEYVYRYMEELKSKKFL